VSRIGESSERIFSFVKNSAFPGKFSGAVGAYNASSLIFDDPEKFERDLLQSMFVPPAEIATQIVPPDQLARFLSETVVAAGIMANLADDMRNLQRSEIAEVGEAVSAEQVGSSTMPQKKNPITFENIKSMFKIVSARLGTVYADLISEHQRDLTGSASGRAAVEIVGYTAIMAQRLMKAMAKLTVHRDEMRAKAMAAQSSAAEAMYIALAAAGHPDAHEAVRILAREAANNGKNLLESAQAEPALRPYLEKLTPRQIECLTLVHTYTGISAEKARAVTRAWRERLIW
jgi:adenylosuccinate lyase